MDIAIWLENVYSGFVGKSLVLLEDGYSDVVKRCLLLLDDA